MFFKQTAYLFPLHFSIILRKIWLISELRKAWNPKMIVANRICGLILLILALVSFLEGMRTWDGMGGTGFMPVIVGGIFTLLGLGILGAKSYAEDRQPIRWPSKIGWPRLISFSKG